MANGQIFVITSEWLQCARSLASCGRLAPTSNVVDIVVVVAIGGMIRVCHVLFRINDVLNSYYSVVFVQSRGRKRRIDSYERKVRTTHKKYCKRIKPRRHWCFPRRLSIAEI